MLLQDKQNKLFCIFFVEVLVTYILSICIPHLCYCAETAGWLAHFLPTSNRFCNTTVQTISRFCFYFANIQTIGYLLYWSIYHKLHKGIKYAFTHYILLRHIKYALLDVGTSYAIEQYSGEEKVLQLPRIKITLSDDLTQGIVYIRNHLKYHTKLESVNISSALGKYIVIQQYISEDENWYIYEIEDSNINRQLVFNSYQEFVDYSKQFGNYTLFMNNKYSIPLSSQLITGVTGSGKTYALYSEVLCMLNWSVKPILYFADPKNSSLYVFGKKIAPARTAGNVEEIIASLKEFHQQMLSRKEELQEKLEEKLDADYRYWNLPAYVYILDEYSAFNAVLQTLPKATKAEVDMILRNIVLQGRQIGCHLWISSQQLSSEDIKTSVRNNLTTKIALGNSPRTLLMTTFEESANLLPEQRKFKSGEGIFTCEGITRQPTITSFPTLKFDILEAVNLITN